MTCQMEVDALHPCRVHGMMSNEPASVMDAAMDPRAPFITKDSGERATFDSGMQRDTETGKARFDLLFPETVPYADQMLTRFAELLARGAEKYNARNWEKADGDAEMARFKSSAVRHLIQWVCGEGDEDHAAAVMFNVMAAETMKAKWLIYGTAP